MTAFLEQLPILAARYVTSGGMRVLTVLGTRPEVIKLAPVIRCLAGEPAVTENLVCSSGQHRAMLDQGLRLFQIQPDIELDVMRPHQSLASLTARLLEGLDRTLGRLKPDWVIGQGDTSTAMVASLAAYYHRVPFAHVEAGLRSGDLERPFPEEANRIIADCLARWRFVPTERSRDLLIACGVPPATIEVTGNTVVDALRLVAGMEYDWSAGPLSTVPNDGPLVLVTAHRRESFGQPLHQIAAAVAELAESYPQVQFVCPVHLNPAVQQAFSPLARSAKNVHLLQPLDYLSLIQLLKQCCLVLTDSGGLQEEAPSMGIPVLVLREETERPEGVEAGVARIVGTDKRRIIWQAAHWLESPLHLSRRHPVNLYGDGRAAERIVAALLGRTAMRAAG